MVWLFNLKALVAIHLEDVENNFQSLLFARVLHSWNIKIFPSVSD